jgi:hypothetical protein
MTSTQNATPTIETVKVGPDLAREWLSDFNTHNRPIREKKVVEYSRDMIAGDWEFNGVPILFGKDGALLDGQHRLRAIMRADVTLDIVVIRGLEAKAQQTVDIGATRTTGDILALRGEANGSVLASIARRTLRYDSAIDPEYRAVLNPTQAEIINYLDANRSLHRAAEVYGRARVVPVAPSVIASAYHIASRIDTEEAELFFVTQVIDCVKLEEGDPALALLRRFQRESVGSRPMPPDEAFRYAIHAWNGFRSRKRMTKIQAPNGGWGASNMPVAQ